MCFVSSFCVLLSYYFVFPCVSVRRTRDRGFKKNYFKELCVAKSQACDDSDQKVTDLNGGKCFLANFPCLRVYYEKTVFKNDLNAFSVKNFPFLSFARKKYIFLLLR